LKYVYLFIGAIVGIAVSLSLLPFIVILSQDIQVNQIDPYTKKIVYNETYDITLEDETRHDEAEYGFASGILFVLLVVLMSLVLIYLNKLIKEGEYLSESLKTKRSKLILAYSICAGGYLIKAGMQFLFGHYYLFI